MWQQCSPRRRQIVSVAHCSNLKTTSSERQKANSCHNHDRAHVNFTKLGLRFHQNASLINNVYCNCKTRILFQLFKQNLVTLFLKWRGKKTMKEKKKNNNRCIIVCSENVSYMVCIHTLGPLRLNNLCQPMPRSESMWVKPDP